MNSYEFRLNVVNEYLDRLNLDENIRNYYSGRTILVTGGEGYVGSNLIKKLLDEGHTVVSIDNNIKPRNRHDGNQ